MIDKIVWSKLKPFKDSKNHSFEELCYQIAKGLNEGEGKFTSIDDSGGGDGVEFYLTFPNGDQWGWQAKFYPDNPRLSVSSRKPSIKKSLEKACKVHPNLKKWFLCTTSDFTPKEQEWFDSTLQKSSPADMDVELIHWGGSDFNNWLSEPRFSGKQLYFFGELELNLDWFKTQFDKQIAGIGDKFDSSLHTETNVDAEIHALLGDKAFVQQITKWIEELEEKLPDLKEEIDEIKRPIPNEIKWDEDEKSKVVEAAELLQDALLKLNSRFEQAKKILDKQDLTAAQAIDWRAAFGQLRKVFDNYEKVTRESGISQIKYIGEQENEEQVLRNASSVVHGPRHLVARLLDKFFPSVTWKQGLINESDLHILGDAGIGKTHIACNICDDRLKNGLPALFVRGSLFTTEQPIEVQLRNVLDIPPSYSWHDFLQALSAAAEAYHIRIPLIIDGLNESVHNGTLSKIWELYLEGFISEIAETKNIVLITTCRTSYKEVIWKEGTPKEFNWKELTWEDKDSLNLVYAYGFERYKEVESAVEKYFNAYKIKADLTGAPLAQFEHPIYLKIFCETKNRERENEVQVYVGEQTLFEVFDEYLNQCNRAVCDRLRLHSKTHIILPTLNKMAEYLWQHRRRDISFDELIQIVDGQSREHLDWQSSKTRAIESEGLLVYRDWADVGEVMHFTYDLLGGYLIAKYLVEQAEDNVQGFLNSEEIIAALFSEDYQTLHPMHEDIVRCLAALLPSTTGYFLHELSEHNKAFGLSIRALFEISPRDINQDCIELVTHLFEQNQEHHDWFFKLAETTVGHSNHPFNASFWSDLLSALSMVDRDISWTEHVRRNRYSIEEMVLRFEETCRNAQDVSEESLLLLAEHIMWILTSTVRPLRDKATRALYWYGRRFPTAFFELVLQSFTINDPYVSERMLAATYGIAMAHHNNFEDSCFLEEELSDYGRELYENMFRPNAPHATTHILARDYAKRTIDIALIHQPDLLTDDEKLRIKPPFTDGGIREWGESKNKNKDEYEKGPAPLQMDFENYTLGALVKNRSPYSNEAPEYKRVVANIRWRIYGLGYTLESFGKIDSQLLTENYRKYSRSSDGRKTDRYGKKYSWIAYFELAGFRHDLGVLPEFYDHGRCIEADIDPSFPNKHREYNFVREDFLGDRDASTKQWVLKTPPPDLTPYLKVDQLCEEQGAWVLLHGHLGQEDKPGSRKMSAWIQGIIVKPEDVDEIVEILKRQENIDGHTVPFIPEDYQTYTGEIPWCDTYPPNDWREFSFLVRKYTTPKEQFELLRGDEPISFMDDFQLWDTARKLIENDDEKRLNEFLHESNLEITRKTVDAERLEHKDFEVLVPVRYNCWEESRSAANPQRSIAVPTREIAGCLDLYGCPQSFDLFEKDGYRRASTSFEYGDIWSNSQNFIYLRKDLLERFLADIRGELIWVIWGYRLQLSENYDGEKKNFHKVMPYSDITKLSVQS